MRITVHYADDDMVNAYATLGGHVVFFRGLLEKLPNENALAMVMAHEIAHIKHRHPIRSLGSGVVIGLTASMISSSLGDTIISQFIGTTGTLTNFKFSREHETEADITAIDSVKALYGHLNGANDLFYILKKQESNNITPDFFSTHPDTASRIQRIRALESDNSIDKITPLPNAFKTWLTPESKDWETEINDLLLITTGRSAAW